MTRPSQGVSLTLPRCVSLQPPPPYPRCVRYPARDYCPAAARHLPRLTRPEGLTPSADQACPYVARTFVATISLSAALQTADLPLRNNLLTCLRKAPWLTPAQPQKTRSYNKQSERTNPYQNNNRDDALFPNSVRLLSCNTLSK